MLTVVWFLPTLNYTAKQKIFAILKRRVMADKRAAKKLAAEMQKQQMQKDFLAREEALNKATSKKLQDKWFGKLLESKIPEMKENLRNILDYMETLVEGEVLRKRLFEEERIELSDQMNFQAQSHCHAIDNLHNLYLQRIHDLHEIYTEQVKRKKEEAEDELNKINTRGEKNEDDLQAILFQMGLNQEKKEDLMKCRMFFETDDEKSKIAEKSESLRTRLERVIERRWYQISNILTDYQQRTEQRRNHYIQLQTRDRHDSKIIQAQMKKTQKLYDQIQQLQNNLENTDLTDPKTTLIADYREERLKFYNSFVYLKQVLAEEMKLDDANLKRLTALSKETHDYFDHFIKKGEKILTLFSLCLKLETEKEKVVPVGRTLYTTKIPTNLVKQMVLPPLHEMAPHIEGINASMLHEFQYFWQKFGKVRLSCVALSHCISEMEEENKNLKKLLHAYFGAISKR